MVVMANNGLCARAAVAGARQQNVPGLQLGDFQFPNVAANLVARDAAAGVSTAGEDLFFGAGSGAIGVGTLDPRISFDDAGARPGRRAAARERRAVSDFETDELDEEPVAGVSLRRRSSTSRGASAASRTC